MAIVVIDRTWKHKHLNAILSRSYNITESDCWRGTDS